MADGRGQLFLEVLQEFGEARLAVTGASMLPSIWPGDVLEVRHLRAEPGSAAGAGSIGLDDIVLFARGSGLVAHRVVQVIAGPGGTMLVTRGDSLLQTDPPVSAEEVLGRVTAVVRGCRRIVPRRTRWDRVASWIFSHSDLCTRVALRVARTIRS